MKKLRLCLPAILMLLSFGGKSQFKVVGYVQPWLTMPDTSKIDFAKLTHLNIAFTNFDSTGTLILPMGFAEIVTAAKNHHVKVLASIGGGSALPQYAKLLNNANRSATVDKLVKLLTDYDLDGIDVDLEAEAIDKNYDPFVAALAAILKPKGKLLTAALATWNANAISTFALKQYDFINVMSYDQTGPWRPNEPGPHSTYEEAVNDLHYWTNTRGFSKKKINLGLPFYGYCFGTKYGESMSYKAIIDSFPDAAMSDMVVPESGGIIYYNGETNIRNKTAMAMKNAGGVMIWQLLQDAEGDKSLLKLIDSTIHSK